MSIELEFLIQGLRTHTLFDLEVKPGSIERKVTATPNSNQQLQGFITKFISLVLFGEGGVGPTRTYTCWSSCRHGLITIIWYPGIGQEVFDNIALLILKFPDDTAYG